MDEIAKAKIDLWKEINGYINKIESNYPMFFTLLIAVLGAALTVLGTNMLPDEASTARLIMLLFLPVALSIIMAYLVYNFRIVAISRMYAAKLEKEINEKLGEDIFIWNSQIIDCYVAKGNFTNTILLPFVSLLFFVITVTVLGYFMWLLPLAIYIKIGYLIVLIILFCCCVAPILKNDSIRTSDFVRIT